MDRDAGVVISLFFSLLMLLICPPYHMSHTKSTRSAAQKVDITYHLLLTEQR